MNLINLPELVYKMLSFFFSFIIFRTKGSLSLRMKLLIFFYLSFISFSLFLSLPLSHFLSHTFSFTCIYSLSRFSVIVLGICLLGINAFSIFLTHCVRKRYRIVTRWYTCYRNKNSTKIFARDLVSSTWRALRMRIRNVRRDLKTNIFFSNTV